MKTLLILRHAHAGHGAPRLADHDRPLSEQGQRDATQVGHWLRENGWLPTLILTSTAVRARATAQAVAEASAHEVMSIPDATLYNASPDPYREILHALGGAHERVMVVGHNPGLETLLFELTRQDEEMPPATLAEVRLPLDRWDELSLHTEGTLVRLQRPDEG